MVGTIAGVAAATIADRYQLVSVAADVYMVSHMPFTVRPIDLVIVVSAAILICFVATIYPSRQAARLDPAQALQIRVEQPTLMPFLEARGVTKRYTVGAGELVVLRDLDLTVETGEMVAIVGASGVGKSTLLHVLGGLDRVDAGIDCRQRHRAHHAGRWSAVAFRNQHVGFVFQFHHLLPEFTRARERRDADAHRADANRRGARARRGAAAAGGSWRAARRTGRDAVGR